MYLDEKNQLKNILEYVNLLCLLPIFAVICFFVIIILAWFFLSLIYNEYFVYYIINGKENRRQRQINKMWKVGLHESVKIKRILK